MPERPLSELPDHARVWIFAASRPLSHEEQAALLERVDAFLAGWAAHGTPLLSGREFRYDRFLVVAVDERPAGASGCSIDALTRTLREVERELDLELLNNAPVLFRDGEAIRRVGRAEFEQLAAGGEVTPETIVFDNTVPTLGVVRDGGWERPAVDSWHRVLLHPEMPIKRRDA